LKVVTKDVRREQICAHHIIKTVRLAETQGFDISDWLRGSMLIAVFGAAAEARYTGRDIQAILNGYEGEADVNSAKSTGAYAGLSASQIDDFIAEAVVRAKNLISQQDIWAAVTSIADAMPNHGTMPGEKVVALVQAACPHRLLTRCAAGPTFSAAASRPSANSASAWPSSAPD
jgi:hypothetical protein